MLDAEAGQLMSVGRSEDDIALDLCVDDLCYDVLVGESDYEAVLGRVVFCAVLGDKLSALLVVGLAFSVGGRWVSQLRITGVSMRNVGK